MRSVTVARNCSAACAEMLGGHCQGPGCPYANTDTAPLGKPWSDLDAIQAAEARGFRKGTREVHAAYETGVVHSIIGVAIAIVLAVTYLQWLS